MIDAMMSNDWLSQSLSIRSITSQYTLPVVVRSALGFRGPSRPIILHSILNITFAYGRALKIDQSKKTTYQSFRPINSEIVAIPLQYPGYFECILPSSHGPDDGIIPEKRIHSIVERMQVDSRPQQFYIAIPMRVYTLEIKRNGERNRVWHQIEAHQILIIEELTHLEYTPTQNDNLTPDDYSYLSWFCFYKRILHRNEYVMKCILSNKCIYYIPCSSTDEVCLYPVGQQGSTNVYKLQTIENLIERFPLPINIKLAQFPGADTYKDFSGHLQLLGSHTKEFVVSASLSSTNVSLISVETPLKFVITPIPLSSVEIINQLSHCEMFIQSFDKQIRRILISSNDISSRRSRSRSQYIMNGKGSSSIDQKHVQQEDQTTPREDDHRSKSSTEKKPNGFRKQRATSTSTDDFSPRQTFKRTLSTGDNDIYNSLVYPIRTKSLLKQSLISLPKKPPHLSTSFTYDTGSNLMKDIDLPNANGAILLDNNNELFSPVKVDN